MSRISEQIHQMTGHGNEGIPDSRASVPAAGIRPPEGYCPPNPGQRQAVSTAPTRGTHHFGVLFLAMNSSARLEAGQAFRIVIGAVGGGHGGCGERVGDAEEPAAGFFPGCQVLQIEAVHSLGSAGVAKQVREFLVAFLTAISGQAGAAVERQQ